jgi:hypothetical protein
VARLLIISAFIVLFQSTSALRAQSLRGLVLDSTSGNPVRGATVMVYEGRRVLADVKPDSAGVFDIALAPSGDMVLHVTALGFDDFTIRLQRRMHPLTVRLHPAPLTVEGVSVTAQRRDPYLNLSGFYQRQRREIGTFIDREQIDKTNPRRITDLFRSVAGARIVPRGANFEVVSRRFSSGRGMCLPMVYLDGGPVGRGGLDDMVLPEDLLGVEAYLSSSRVPAQYSGSNAACGVILLWTRMK